MDSDFFLMPDGPVLKEVGRRSMLMTCMARGTGGTWRMVDDHLHPWVFSMLQLKCETCGEAMPSSLIRP